MNTATAPVTLRADIFETDRGSTWVEVEFSDEGCSRGKWTTIVSFKNAGHKIRAAEYVTIISREFASPVKAVRALAEAERETLPARDDRLQFVDSLLSLMGE